jgi:hypothetical protein
MGDSPQEFIQQMMASIVGSEVAIDFGPDFAGSVTTNRDLGGFSTLSCGTLMKFRNDKFLRQSQANKVWGSLPRRASMRATAGVRRRGLMSS